LTSQHLHSYKSLTILAEWQLERQASSIFNFLKKRMRNAPESSRFLLSSFLSFPLLLFRASRREREYQSWVFPQNRQRNSCYYYYYLRAVSCLRLHVKLFYMEGGPDLSLNLQLTLILYYIEFPQVLSGNFFGS